MNHKRVLQCMSASKNGNIFMEVEPNIVLA